MSRLSFYDACKVASDPRAHKVAELNDALTALKDAGELVKSGIYRIEREFKGRIAAHRAREMNAEFPDDVREVLKLKGMIE